MRLASLCLAALAGCMKIYPDSELPDLEVEWFAGFGAGCEGDQQVAIVATELDDETVRYEATAACDASPVRFEDVARVRHRVRGELIGTDGLAVATAEAEVDLRDGLDERTGLFFDLPDNLRVQWTFDMEATCESLAIAPLLLELAEGEDTVRTFGVPCPLSRFEVSIPPGVFTVRAVGLSQGEPVAISPPTEPLTFVTGAVTDAGTLVLSPCAPSCER